MEKIKSFTIDHDAHGKGFYLSGEADNIYTYDLRFKTPNGGDYLSAAVMHTIEHLFATAVRNGKLKSKVVYFGPMGCRTGFYLLLSGIKRCAALQLVRETLKECLLIEQLPGADRRECGNYKEHDLQGAREQIKKYTDVLGCVSAAERGVTAGRLFKEGYNCAQSVLLAFMDELPVTEDEAKAMSIAFGGGFAGTRGLCGAVSAMGMVIGLLRGNSADKAEIYKEVQCLIKKFEERNGYKNCGELLLNVANITASYTPEPRNAEYYAKRPCVKFVADSAEILHAHLAESGLLCN